MNTTLPIIPGEQDEFPNHGGYTVDLRLATSTYLTVLHMRYLLARIAVNSKMEWGPKMLNIRTAGSRRLPRCLRPPSGPRDRGQNSVASNLPPPRRRGGGIQPLLQWK